MVRGFFLVADANFLKDSSGIGKKIRKQIETFNNNGIDCSMILQKDGRENINPFIGKILYYLPFTNIAPQWEVLPEYCGVDFLYFRHPGAITFRMKKTLKKIKELNPSIKIYMEIPTFPYDGEYIGLKKKIELLKDRINRKHLKNFVDCIFPIDPMNVSDGFFDVKTIKFINGYDVENTFTRRFIEHEGINLACVGMFNKWHGYERIIEGLKNYYEEGGLEKINVFFVGDGEEMDYYRHLVTMYHLDDQVTFFGKKFGTELDEIYSITDIGIASLGRYKCGITILGDLKTREYFAKGIPVLSGCKVDFFEIIGEKNEFYMEIANDPSPVDMSDIISFYLYIKKCRTNMDIESYLHNYALNTFDISKTLLPVINELKAK